MRILGVDPGSRVTGYGLVDSRRGRLGFVTCGTIRTTDEKDFSRRLHVIFSELGEIVDQYRPDAAAVRIRRSPIPRCSLKTMPRPHTVLQYVLDMQRTAF